MKNKRLFWNEKSSIGRLAAVLRGGGLVLGSSDTILGFLANLSQKSKTEIDTLKRRSGKPYIILLGSREQLLGLVDEANLLHIEKLMAHYWPGPLTLILKAKPEIPAWMKAEDGTIAVRIPDHPGLLELLKEFDGLFSTSANISGQPVPKSIQEVDERILAAVEEVVLDSEPQEGIAPSTILDCTDEQVRVVREGTYSIEELERIHGARIVST